MVSWRNPEADDRDLGLDDYLQQGVMQAMAVVSRLTGAKRIHGMGYCLGGTFLSIAAAALGRTGGTDPTHKLRLGGRPATPGSFAEFSSKERSIP